MRKVGKVVLESLLVTVVGVGLAFAANAKSSRGLNIWKDYFEVGRRAPAPGPTSQSKPVTRAAESPASSSAPAPDPSGSGDGGKVNTNDKYAETKKLVDQAGFKAIEYDEIRKLYDQESKSGSNACIFIDAREQAQYSEGHMPLAYRVDHVKPDETIKTAPLLYLLPSAEKIVLYCHGGNCEDSLFVAGDLQKAGIDQAKLHVYVGGFTEWMEKKQPVEKGDRGSGEITNGGAQ